MTSSLPTDVDSSYPDRSPGDAAHQQHHDVLHALNNVFHGAADGQRFEKQGGELVAVENGASDAFEITPFARRYSVTGGYTISQSSGFFNAGRVIIGGSQNDEIVFGLPSPTRGGTWDVRLLHDTDVNRAIATIAVSADASTWTDLTTIDMYAGSSNINQITDKTGLTVPSSARFVRIKLATRNASSSGWLGVIYGLSAVRTGA